MLLTACLLAALCVKKTKRKEEFVWFLLDVYRFLSISTISTAPTAMIATIMPAVAGTKYMSATDSGVGVGGGVAAGASSTFMAVSA
jgi:hypothetical protein